MIELAIFSCIIFVLLILLVIDLWRDYETLKIIEKGKYNEYRNNDRW